ncbi:MAG: chemotaxis protein CheA [Deltaproteobacteria bacterium]|nr:chemotaxis protein CheA [Deltaproteobacteria bacterium]
MSEQPQDISKKALQEFLSEAEEIIEKLNQDLLLLEEAAPGGAVDPDLLNEIFRSAHSLKGLSGMFGFSKVMSLSHNLENLLDRLRMGKVSLTAPVTDVLLSTVELLRKIVAQTSEGGDEFEERQIDGIIARLESVLSDDRAADESGPLDELEIDPEMLNVLTEYEEHRLIENVRQRRRIYMVHANFDLLTFDQALGELTAQLKQHGEVITTLPAASPSKETEIEFEIIVGSDLRESVIREALQRSGAKLKEIAYRNPRKQDDGQRFDDGMPSSTGMSRETFDEGVSSLKSVSETVRVDIRKLDFLMNLVGELGQVKSKMQQLTEIFKGKREHEGPADLIRKIAKDFDRKLAELQTGVMDVRMVPLRQVFDKLSRIVKTTARDLRKNVALEVEGADTELDKLIVEELVDPLMHIVRNAIDHGIEPVPERVACGKPEKATLWIRASQRGNHVVIEIEDDGRGMHSRRIYEAAVAKGHVQEGAKLSRREILDLVLLPGFSTKSEVSETSGRGVGLDIVKERIAKLSGIIEIDSEEDKGTTLSIMLPITLAIIQALIVEVRGRIYALPLNSVLECLTVDHNQIQTIERREVLQFREEILPLARLASFFKLGEQSPAAEKSFVVVVGLAEHRLGIVVDGLHGRQDIVIKSLGKLLPEVRGISGATELGDQRTVLVIDIGALIEEAIHRKD